MTTVLEQLSLVAYRGIADLVLPGLTPFSLIVGANNAGKTSILEAASLFLRPVDPAPWMAAVQCRDADGPFIDGLWSMFPICAAPPNDLGEPCTSKELRIAGVAATGSRDVHALCTLRSQAITWGGGAKWGDGSRWGEESVSADVDVRVDGDPPVVLKFPSPTAGQHQVPLFRVFTVNAAAHYSTRTMIEHLSRVIDEGKKQLAVNVLRIFDPEVEDLDIVAWGNAHAVRVTHAQRGVVPLSSFGDGMRQAAIIALKLTRASQGVLLIDELEAGIHPSVLPAVVARLYEAAATAQCQILATTHSLEAVDAVVGAVEASGATETLCAFYLRRVDGKHEARRYDFAHLLELREGGLDIR